jgi:hypothetical protein
MFNDYYDTSGSSRERAIEEMGKIIAGIRV